MQYLNNKSIEQQHIIVQIINDKLKYNNKNCIYCLNNKLFDKIIKIGSTIRPEFRKYDYHTSSPYPFYYDWVFYLDKFNCYFLDDIIKFELNNYRIKEHGSIEFYSSNISFNDIEDILKKYKISYHLELGDKFKDRPLTYNKNYDKIDLNKYKSNLIKMDPSEIQLLALIKSISKDRLQDLGINLNSTNNSVEEDCDHSYLDGIISKLDFNTVKNDISCQSINFIYDKMRNPNKINRKSLILGDIQSGKTNEIIQLSYFICRYLRIPVIIMLQNKKAGITQLRVRLDQFNQHNKINFKLKYKITSGQSVKKSHLSELFHPQNHRGEIIICLCNPKQLNKIKNSIELCKDQHSKVAPYICLIDEYDDLIKSRHDIDESNKNKNKNKKKTEIPALYLQKKSYLSIGITATLLAPMMQEDKLTKEDIFKLKTNDNYVGYMSTDRLQLFDISKHIIRPKGKKTTKLNSTSISYIIKDIEHSINSIKTYSITLFNISDKKEDHRQYSEDIRNEFPDWGVVQFHSNEDNKILCELPENNNITKEEEIRKGDKLITIKLHKCRIPDYKLKLIERGEDRFYDKYSIEFENMSIQEVITKLLEYTNKICIMSGRMATRGISFVNNDYSKHITDLVYVPSDASHVTRNVQDMRIFGNFNKDGIMLTLYIEKAMYEDNIQKYHNLQITILNEIHQNKSIKDGIMELPINTSDIPSKKLDRPALMKGLEFNNSNTWGISIGTDDLEEAKIKIKNKYKDYNIIVYSKKHTIPIDKPFEPPQKIPGFNKLQQYYKNKIDLFTSSTNRINYIYPDYKNGWPLHNPIHIKYNINQKRSIPDVCYYGKIGTKTLDLIIRDKSIDIDKISTNTIVIFYSREGYHYSIKNNNLSLLTDKFNP